MSLAPALCCRKLSLCGLLRIAALAFLTLLVFAAAAAAQEAPVTPERARLLDAYAKLKAGDLAGAKAGFAATVTLAPATLEAAEATLRLGYLGIKMNDKEAARANWLAVAERFPATGFASEAMLRLGHMAFAAGKPEEAAAWYDRGSEITEAPAQLTQTNLMEAGFARISQYWRKRETKYLLDALRRLTVVRSHLIDKDTAARTWIGIGEANLLMGFANDAQDAYTTALEYQPGHPYLRGIARFGQACAMYAARDWRSAQEAFDMFLQDLPGSTLEEKSGLWRSARPGFAGLSATDPERAESLSGLDVVPHAAYWKGKALFEMGSFLEAKAIAEGLLEDFPDLRTANRVQELRLLCENALKNGR